jgi:hypothetical protein
MVIALFAFPSHSGKHTAHCGWMLGGADASTSTTLAYVFHALLWGGQK